MVSKLPRPNFHTRPAPRPGDPAADARADTVGATAAKPASPGGGRAEGAAAVGAAGVASGAAAAAPDSVDADAVGGTADERRARRREDRRNHRAEAESAASDATATKERVPKQKVRAPAADRPKDITDAVADNLVNISLAMTRIAELEAALAALRARVDADTQARGWPCVTDGEAMAAGDSAIWAANLILLRLVSMPNPGAADSSARAELWAATEAAAATVARAGAIVSTEKIPIRRPSSAGMRIAAKVDACLEKVDAAEAVMVKRRLAEGGAWPLPDAALAAARAFITYVQAIMNVGGTDGGAYNGPFEDHRGVAPDALFALTSEAGTAAGTAAGSRVSSMYPSPTASRRGSREFVRDPRGARVGGVAKKVHVSPLALALAAAHSASDAATTVVKSGHRKALSGSKKSRDVAGAIRIAEVARKELATIAHAALDEAAYTAWARAARPDGDARRLRDAAMMRTRGALAIARASCNAADAACALAQLTTRSDVCRVAIAAGWTAGDCVIEVDCTLPKRQLSWENSELARSVWADDSTIAAVTRLQKYWRRWRRRMRLRERTAARELRANNDDFHAAATLVRSVWLMHVARRGLRARWGPIPSMSDMVSTRSPVHGSHGPHGLHASHGSPARVVHGLAGSVGSGTSIHGSEGGSPTPRSGAACVRRPVGFRVDGGGEAGGGEPTAPDVSGSGYKGVPRGSILTTARSVHGSHVGTPRGEAARVRRPPGVGLDGGGDGGMHNRIGEGGSGCSGGKIAPGVSSGGGGYKGVHQGSVLVSARSATSSRLATTATLAASLSPMSVAGGVKRYGCGPNL